MAFSASNTSQINVLSISTWLNEWINKRLIVLYCIYPLALLTAWAFQKHSQPQQLTLCWSLHIEALQATAGKGLAQGPYMAARAGFEPTTLWSNGVISTNTPPCPIAKGQYLNPNHGQLPRGEGGNGRWGWKLSDPRIYLLLEDWNYWDWYYIQRRMIPDNRRGWDKCNESIHY